MFTSQSPDRWDTAVTPASARVVNPSYRGRDRRRRVAAAFDPVFIGRSVWRWRWLVAITTVLGLGLGAAVAVSTPKIYLAATQVLLDPRDLKVVQNEVAPNALPSDATLALIESQAAIVMSGRVLSGVIEKAGLAADPEFNGQERRGLIALLPDAMARTLTAPAEVGPAAKATRVLEGLRAALTVEREPKSFIINLEVKSENAAKSARLANLVSDAFIAELGRIQSDTARKATVELSSRLSELRRSVVEAEGRAEDYKARNSLIGVNGRLVDDDYITRINDQLAKARADITALRVKAESLRAASVDDVVAGTLPEELNSEALARLRQTYAELAQLEGSLATKLGPRHPQRIANEGALAASRQSIRRELGRIVAAAQTEYARAAATERDLTSQVETLKAKQVETSGAFVKLRELEREVDASRAVYEAFLLRARETSEQESLNTANIRVITEATPPLRSAGPSRKIVTAAGGVGGFLFGIAIVAAFAMLRLLSGILRQDRRGDAAAPVFATSETAASSEAVPPSGLPASPERWAEVASALAARDRRAGDVAVGAAQSSQDPYSRVDADLPAFGSDSQRRRDRSVLRERIRALSGANDGADREVTAEAAAIEREIRSVRETLAELRRRRLPV